MINGFRDFLKHGNRAYYEVLLYHFLAGITNKPEFREINDWAIFPSSGVNLNTDMLEFKDKARELMNGKKKQPIFIRHTKTWKSHESYKYNVDRLPADRHFDTIILNDYYKYKLNGRVVCVFDDYLTYGTSFETVRNLLLKTGVKKMFLVSLGRFHKRGYEYFRQDYKLTGSIYAPDYNYNLTNSRWLFGKFDNTAITEIENLHDIIYK